MLIDVYSNDHSNKNGNDNDHSKKSSNDSDSDNNRKNLYLVTI